MIGNCSSLLTQLSVHCCFLPLHHLSTSRCLHLFSPSSISPLTLFVSLSTSFVVTPPPASLPHHYLIQSSHLSFRLIALSPIPPSPIPSSLLPFHPPILPSFSHFQTPFVPPSPTLSLSSLHYPPPSLPPAITYSSHPPLPYFSSLSVT